MPVTATITKEQRDGLYELVRNHLGGIGDVWIALEQNEDYATAERLGLEFGEDFRLLQDIGWRPNDSRETFELTMPAHDLRNCRSASTTKPKSCSSNRPASAARGRKTRRPTGASGSAWMLTRKC